MTNLTAYETDLLDSAIDRSESHTEIVTLDWDGDINAAVAHLSSRTDNADSVTSGEITEVWGWSDDADEGAMDWRVHLRQTAN